MTFHQIRPYVGLRRDQRPPAIVRFARRYLRANRPVVIKRQVSR